MTLYTRRVLSPRSMRSGSSLIVPRASETLEPLETAVSKVSAGCVTSAATKPAIAPASSDGATLARPTFASPKSEADQADVRPMAASKVRIFVTNEGTSLKRSGTRPAYSAGAPSESRSSWSTAAESGLPSATERMRTVSKGQTAIVLIVTAAAAEQRSRGVPKSSAFPGPAISLAKRRMTSSSPNESEPESAYPSAVVSAPRSKPVGPSWSTTPRNASMGPLNSGGSDCSLVLTTSRGVSAVCAVAEQSPPAKKRLALALPLSRALRSTGLAALMPKRPGEMSIGSAYLPSDGCSRGMRVGGSRSTCTFSLGSRMGSESPPCASRLATSSRSVAPLGTSSVRGDILGVAGTAACALAGPRATAAAEPAGASTLTVGGSSTR
mmetsp:Transcript_37879/g.89102  ORF Transcript_37879/g.89102 Transcript_37879/m.89102 type:complete len:382 (-) Transcript_37879:336-1481(-)